MAASVCWEQVAASGCSSGCSSKWLQVSAGSKAASGCSSGCSSGKWLQLAAVAASGCSSGCKWLLKWLQVAASGKGAFWKQISAILRPLGQLLNFSSGIIGKRPFLAKSWPGAFWKQISAIWWLLGASGCKWLQVAAGSKWLQVGASGCRKTPENFQHSPVEGTGEF